MRQITRVHPYFVPRFPTTKLSLQARRNRSTLKARTLRGVPVHLFDSAMPVISEKYTPRTQGMQLLFVVGSVQTIPVWILADLGLIRNHVDKAVYNRLPYQFPIWGLGHVRVIVIKGEFVILKRYIVLPVFLRSNSIWHEFGVVLYFQL